MARRYLPLLILSLFSSQTLGWEPGTQYEYKYVGRSVAGIYNLKLQNAVIELQSRVIVQSVDENTVILKLTEGRVKRNGNYFKDPYFGSEAGHPEEVEGDEDKIPNPELFEAPFVIIHNKGSIIKVQIGAEEPQWIVNYKKSIAGQLQLDVTGVRNDGSAVNLFSLKGGESTTFSTYEDSITGDCSITIAISQLRRSQIIKSDIFKLDIFNDICKGKPVYQIVKTKDYNKCKKSPVWHSTTSNVYNCDFDKVNCGDFMQRISLHKYLACGDNFPNVTIVHVSGFSDIFARPFAVKTDELVNSVVIGWSLEKKHSITSRLSVSSTLKEHKNMSYVHEDFHQLNQDETPAQPNLSDAYFRSPTPVSILHKNILDAMQIVDRNLKERPDSEKDNLERLSIISRLLPMFSLDELRALWQDTKCQNSVIQTLFVDCLVVAGHNPAIMLIKELIESKQLSGQAANFALSSLGFYAKTPTRELLHELLNLLKSSSVQSSKTALQTTLMTVADLLFRVCNSRFPAAKRFPISVLGDFCDRNIIVNEFLPILVKQLESSQNVFDRIVVLTAFGSLGVEEIVPILLPVIRGTPGKFDDNAERLRAVLSLHRAVFTAPQKIHPILSNLANNVGERPEIRMASIGILFMSNAPLPLWQKLAASTWFESSSQIKSFINNLINSIASAPATTPLVEQLIAKARIALPMVKPAPFGVSFSIGDIQSSHLDEDITVMMHTRSFKNTDQLMPVYFAHRYTYQLGPFLSEPLSIHAWNFNTADLWQNLFSKFYNRLSVKYGALWSDRKDKREALNEIWDELNVSAKPADKPVGLFHINLLGSINRLVNLEDLDKSIPKYMANMFRYQNRPYEISLTKYRILAEYNVRFAIDLGLPMRYLFTVPILASMQGTVNSDGRTGIQSNLHAELSGKLSAELRIDLPFNGNYIATGVDVLIDSHSPQQMNFNYNSGELKLTWTSGNKVTDLLYYHVKPYTITRNLVDSIKPTLEDPAVNLISITDNPTKREWPLGKLIGANVRLIEESELVHTDYHSWKEYFSKMDINILSNLGFVPLDVRYRKYVIRYDPSGSKSKSVSTTFFYQYATKTNKNTLVYESGSSQSRKPSSPEIVSYKPIASEFRPLLGRLFINLDSGHARLMRANVTSEQTDGTIINFKSVIGIATGDRQSRDLIDWQAEYSTTSSTASKQVNFAICYNSVRNWNKPPTYGFSKDLLEFYEKDDIRFGPECEHKVNFTANIFRDEDAAKAAIESESGQQCLLDMESGLHGSPTCTEARVLDHTYNNYELISEINNMTDSWIQWARRTTTWMNQINYPFTISHVHAQSNTPNRATWIIRRNPNTGEIDVKFIRPHETVVSKNVRLLDEISRISPLTTVYTSAFFPLMASSNYILQAAKITSAGVSEAKCYVGSYGVYTFDGAHYNYTVDGCPHVLMTDCHRRSELAVITQRGRDEQKIVTVIYGKDTFELDPLDYVIVNGVKTHFKDVENNYIEIRSPGAKSITVVISPLVDGGVILEIRSLLFFVKVQESHVELSAPLHLRGRTCGLCGDFNQEIDDDFKTPERCTLTSGDLMAASFRLKSGENCPALGGDIERSLKDETETCDSNDQQFPTYLPDYIL